MAVTLTPTGKTPSNTQFGLDTFTERYKCDATADEVLTDAGVPQMGDAHPDYPFMFVTGRPCYETGESASALDLIYTGCLTDDGGGNPILPAQQNNSGAAVQSATSSRGSTGGLLTSPATIQFYAPTNTLSYMSFGAKGTTFASTPSGTPIVQTVTVGDTSYTISNLITDLIDIFFTLYATQTIESTEVVSGQYWSNVARTTLAYVPFIFDVPSGPFLTLAAPGNGYAVSDSITVTGGSGVATVIVDSVGSVFGGGSGIISYHVTAISMTTADTLMPGSGGHGTGSLWNVMIIP